MKITPQLVREQGYIITEQGTEDLVTIWYSTRTEYFLIEQNCKFLYKTTSWTRLQNWMAKNNLKLKANRENNF